MTIKVIESRYTKEPYKIIDAEVKDFVNRHDIDLTEYVKAIEIHRGYDGFIKIIEIIWRDDTRTDLLKDVDKR